MKKLIISLLIIPFSLNISAQSILESLSSFVSSDLEVNSLYAPEIFLYNVEKIAILKFDDDNSPLKSYFSNTSDNGTKLADYMTEQLILANRGQNQDWHTFIEGFNTKFYTVVERTKINEVLREQDFGLSGSIEESQAISVGKLLGIDVIILGGVSHIMEEGVNVDRSKTRDGNIQYSYTAIRRVKAEARMKIISVETGEVLGTTTKEALIQDKQSSNSRITNSINKTEQELANEAFSDIAFQLVDYFSPRYDPVGLNLNRIRVRDYRTQGREIENMLKDDRIDKALLMTKELYELDPYNSNITYNMGVMYEGTGNFELAHEAYSNAILLDPDNRNANKALERINSVLELKEYLTSLGMELTPYSFQTEGSTIANRITTRGRKRDRVNVYDDKSQTAGIAARVPGDTEFEIIENSGDWYLIKLLGDKQGYVHQADVK